MATQFYGHPCSDQTTTGGAIMRYIPMMNSWRSIVSSSGPEKNSSLNSRSKKEKWSILQRPATQEWIHNISKWQVQECKELLKLGLIAESKFSWACEAFYVNKRAEQARGKLRLVINYRPLNQCLKDVKFPLPRRSMIFSHLPGAQWFSKFDLKAGF